MAPTRRCASLARHLTTQLTEAGGLQLLINGQLKAAEGGATAPVINPATGAEFARVPDASGADLEEAVKAAGLAYQSWRNTTYDQRKECMVKFSQLLAAKKQEFAEALTKEQGKPLKMAMGEVDGVIASFVRVAEEAPKWMAPKVTHEDENARFEIHYRPRGVVGGIVPWNFPLSIAAGTIRSAVVTGNTIVLKPSPYTPLTAVMMAPLMREAFPPGVVNILSGPDALGQKIVEHEGVSHISFTGSAATGKRIMSTASATLKKVTLELGGNDPALVLPGTDIKAVAPKIFGKAMMNTGQVCVAIKRVFVHESQYDDMIAAMKEEAGKAKVGDGLSADTQFGPLNNAMQFEKVKGIVEEAKAKGATVVAGGSPGGGPNPNGYYYQPTILGDVQKGMRIVDEEQFGPVLPIIKYKDVQEAVKEANDTTYGLGASVWTNNPESEQTQSVALQLESGMSYINDHADGHETVPFGGVKGSGIGRNNGMDIGLSEYTDIKTVKVTKAKVAAKVQ
jgi:acyl-CoA reductase-like NAD-dependent aldehyde dehydrogenase